MRVTRDWEDGARNIFKVRPASASKVILNHSSYARVGKFA